MVDFKKPNGRRKPNKPRPAEPNSVVIFDSADVTRNLCALVAACKSKDHDQFEAMYDRLVDECSELADEGQPPTPDNPNPDITWEGLTKLTVLTLKLFIKELESE